MIISIDVGGTTIKAALVSKNRIIRKITEKTPSDRTGIVQKIAELAEKLGLSKVKKICIGCPGPADYKKGVIGDTPNLPLKGVNLKTKIAEKTGKEVFVQNDAGCFALGESLRLKKKNIAALTLGTGVGGGIIICGKIYTGRGNAGHFGHCTIKYDGEKSKFNRGALEEYASAKAIEKRYKKSPEELKSKRAWKEIGTFIGIGLSNIINSFDPDIITIGGGISNRFDDFRLSMEKEIKERTISKTKVVKGKEDSGLLGAALI